MRIERRGRRPCRIRILILPATILALLAAPGLCRAERPATASGARPFPARGASAQPGSDAPTRAQGSGSGSWWVGTAGVALALAACGWVSVAARKSLPKLRLGSSPLRIVGRTALSPRHTVYLLDAGGRVLIVGTGPQGAPSLLGELTDPEALARLGPRPATASHDAPARFDHLVGDDA